MDSTNDPQWAALAAIWQTPADQMDMADIRRALYRRERRALGLFLLDFAQGLIQVGLGLFLLARWTPPSNLVGASLLAFGIFAIALALWSRFGAGRDVGPTGGTAVSQLIRQAQAGIRWAISGYLVIGCGVILLLILGYAHGQADYQSIVPLPYWLKAGFAVSYLLFWLWRCNRLLAENRRQLRGLKTIEDDIASDEPTAGSIGKDR